MLALIAACTSTQQVLENGELKLGQSKKEGKDLFLLSFDDNPFLCECGEYYEDLQIEILPNTNRNIFLVYEDVTRPLKDYIDDIGNGWLLGFYKTYEEAYAVIEKFNIAQQKKFLNQKEKKVAAEKATAKQKELERTRRIAENKRKFAKFNSQKLNNNSNKKIINGIKFVLSGDNAVWHSSDIPISQQNYSFGNCVYTTWDENSGKLSQWDFNKINWKTRSASVVQNWILTNVYDTYYDYSCDGACRTSGDYSYSDMSFKAIGDGFRTVSALRDIKRQCRGSYSPY
jgi:hypothetical protein